MRSVVLFLVLLTLAPVASVLGGGSFVNFETPHVHPLELTPNGERLLAVNTAAGRLEVFSTTSGSLIRLRSIPVGVDPVSVRARSNTEAWVVNHVSDSVSIVDLVAGRVRATLATDDEPADVVFAGTPLRAFVTCSQANTVQVFDPASLLAAPVTIPIDGEDPRALAVSPDGGTVYAAVFESGNSSTLLAGRGALGGIDPPNAISHPAGPWGGQNPPPNSGNGFDPPLNPANPAPNSQSLIVKKDDGGQWMDDNGGNWTDLVSGPLSHLSGRPQGWDLIDNDIVVIDANTLTVSYVDRLMNIGMALAVDPVTGTLGLVGTDATNEIRFEPNLTGTFLRVNIALVDAGAATASIVDLNPHLGYGVSTVTQDRRDLSIGDPRGVAWSADGSRIYVVGMGSNNLVVVDDQGTRQAHIDLGEGPTGIVLHESAGVAYVLDKFEAAISVVNLSPLVEVARVPFPDPTPSAIKIGRKHLYGTHETSGLGQLSCAGCHVDARMDRLGWDLGNPAGSTKSYQGQNLAGNLPLLTPVALFRDFHPMKGPMVTQTLQDIVGKEPLHWQGDKDGLEDFNGAFMSLQGDDAMLTPQEMQEFEDFLATITFPPNPFREIDNSLPTNLPLPGHFNTGLLGPLGDPLPPGDAQNGLTLFMSPALDLGAGTIACSTCHALPLGMGTNTTFNGLFLEDTVDGPLGEQHHMLVPISERTFKVPQLRNLHEKVGYEPGELVSRGGFGFEHDGDLTLARAIASPMFAFTTTQDLSDVLAFLLSFSGSDLPTGSPFDLNMPPGTVSQDSHAAVGRQLTLRTPPLNGSPEDQLLDSLLWIAESGDVGLVAQGRQGGLPRGFTYIGGGSFQSDRSAEVRTDAELRASVGQLNELTFTVVPSGSETRLGIDRDGDGAFDRDELDRGSDPDDAASVPGPCGLAGEDLGYGSTGAHGVAPRFRTCGTLSPITTADLVLEDAPPNTLVYIVVSTSTVMANFAGGTLVPAPDFLIGPVATDGAGRHEVLGVPGKGGPVDLYVQWIVIDPNAPFGRSLSNAIKLTIEP